MQGTAFLTRPTAGGEQAILMAAEQLFSDKGFAGASMSQIARLAGVSKANVFHHFSSKKILYLAVLRQVCNQSTGSLFMEHPEPGPDARERLQGFVSTHLQGLLQNRQSTRLILREVTDADDSEGRELSEQLLARYFRRLVKMVTDGQDEGLLHRDFDPNLLAYLLVAANNFYFQTRSVLPHLTQAPFAQNSERFAVEMFELFLRGVSSNDGDPSEIRLRRPV